MKSSRRMLSSLYVLLAAIGVATDCSGRFLRNRNALWAMASKSSLSITSLLGAFDETENVLSMIRYDGVQPIRRFSPAEFPTPAPI